MPGNNNPYVDLLKYPITIFAILLALVVARFTLGITFGPVTKVSSEGVEFAQASTAKLGDLEGRVNGLAMELEALKTASTLSAHRSTVRADTSALATLVADRSLEARVFEATQAVSDQTAQLARLGARVFPSKAKQKGFIWIGDYTGKWERAKLGSPETGEPLALAPAELQPGSEFRVLDNMVIRDAVPEKDQHYLRGPSSLGIISRGSRVRLVGEAVRVDRGFATQYWAEVEIVK